MPDPNAVEDAVRDHYAAAAKAAPSCCGGSVVDPSEIAVFGASRYEEGDLADLPPEAVAASFGCANPVALADLSAGQVVLDLGSGGGIDVLIAARRVGSSGSPTTTRTKSSKARIEYLYPRAPLSRQPDQWKVPPRPPCFYELALPLADRPQTRRLMPTDRPHLPPRLGPLRLMELMSDHRASKWRLVHDERKDMLTFFRSLTPEEWDEPSLCSGWRIRDMVAHLLIHEPVQARAVQRVLPMFVRGGFSVDRANAWWVEQNRRRTPESITECFHEDSQKKVGLLGHILGPRQRRRTHFLPEHQVIQPVHHAKPAVANTAAEIDLGDQLHAHAIPAPAQ